MVGAILGALALGLSAGFMLGVMANMHLRLGQHKPAAIPRKPFDWSLFKKAEPEAPRAVGAISRTRISWRKQRRTLERSHNIQFQQQAGFSPNTGATDAKAR